MALRWCCAFVLLTACDGDWLFKDAGPTDTATTTTDTTPSAPLDCSATIVTPPPGTPLGTCVTQEVTCGDVVDGTLDGGSTEYDYDYWLMVGELDAMLGEFDAFDGQERVYVFRGLEAGQRMTATFETCFDLWANWVLVGPLQDGFCDTANQATAGVFEGGSGQVWSTTRLNADGGPSDFALIVEGLYGALGNYRLTILCH